LADERLNQYRAAASALTGARAAVATARANLRVEQARQTKAGADVGSAQARLKVAQANLKQAEILLAYGRVRAPFAGVLTRRMADTGVFVQSAGAGKASPLFTLACAGRLRIVANIPEPDTTWVQVGQPATLRVDAVRGRMFPGKVVRLADALDPATRTMRVEVELDGSPRVLRPGLFGALTITLADLPDALLLPTSALVPAGDRPAVMVVGAGRAHRQDITIGSNDGIRMQITDGLKGDELVITDGKDLVREGQPVEVVP
jgi:RND family efflux transporter MFP subunit